MISPIFYAVGVALLTGGLLIEVTIFRAIHADPPSTYKLFALRDKLVRLVVDGKIRRDEPHFDALYRNVNILLKGCRCLSGPDGWKVAEAAGKHLAHHGNDQTRLTEIPRESPPEALEPVVSELRTALEHLVKNHFGLFVMMDERRRELGRMQKERAKQFLKMMPETV
jgi:hypothetical protein